MGMKIILFSIMIILAGCGPEIYERNGEMFVKAPKSMEATVTGEGNGGNHGNQNNGNQNKMFKTVMVLGIMPRYEVKKSVEDEFVKEMENASIGAVASYQALLPDTPITKEAVSAQLKDTGVDGVLVLKLKDIVREIKQPVSGGDAQPFEHDDSNDEMGERDLFDYWNAGVSSNGTAEFASASEEVEVLVRLYSLDTGKFVWQGKYTATNFGGRMEITKSIALMVLKALSDGGFV
jgi:hypothetical protein